MKAKHAVLCKVKDNAYLAYLKNDGESFGFRQVEMPQTFEGLVDLAVAQEWDHYWIHPSASIVPDVKWSKYNKESYDLFTSMSSDDRHGVMGFAHGWKLPSGGAKAVDLFFPHNTGWAKDRGKAQWGSAADPKTMLLVIAYIEEALGIAPAAGPSSTGWDFVKHFHKGHLQIVPQRKLAEMHFTRAAGFDLIDVRKPYADELRKRFIIKLDKNSAYIAACASKDTFYGVGTPVHTTHYDPKAVGVWNVVVYALGEGPFPIISRVGEARWLAGPIVRLLQNQRYEVEVKEGFVFPEMHTYLRNWALHLWDARESLKHDTNLWPNEKARQMAYEAIKMIAVKTIGVTSFGGFAKDEVSEKERPDIKLQTVSRNYELMYHNILSGQQIDGVVPFLVNNDCVHLLVDDIDPHVSAPTYMKREGKLGGYKREGWMEVNAEVRELLSSNLGALQLKKKLDERGWSN